MSDETRGVLLGSVEQVPIGQGFCFIVEGQEIAVFRQRDGRVFATQNRCPHKQGPLAEGIIGNGTVVCPLHAHRFDMSNGQGSEARECVKVYPVQLSNGIMTLRLPVVEPALVACK
jgi:nitrite reductase (NADH) small subunit